MYRRKFLHLAAITTLVSGFPALAQSSAKVLSAGRLSGRSNHITTGTVSVQQSGGKTYLVLGEDFSLDGAPDPTLGFGKGSYDPSTKFSDLRELTGQQIYELPARLDASEYDQFYVWCTQFNVPLGVATLTAR